MGEINKNRAKLQTLLTELGLAPIEQDGDSIQIVIDGVYATVVIYGDGTLSLLCSVKGKETDWDLRGINAANNRVRFAKFSVERGNLLLEADFVFHISSADAVERLKELLNLWHIAMHELKVLVEELVPA